MEKMEAQESGQRSPAEPHTGEQVFSVIKLKDEPKNLHRFEKDSFSQGLLSGAGMSPVPFLEILQKDISVTQETVPTRIEHRNYRLTMFNKTDRNSLTDD